MRDVNNGWLIRYLHSNTASAFFFLVTCMIIFRTIFLTHFFDYIPNFLLYLFMFIILIIKEITEELALFFSVAEENGLTSGRQIRFVPHGLVLAIKALKFSRVSVTKSKVNNEIDCQNHFNLLSDKDFYEWFRGFTDAEGCFHISPVDKRFKFIFAICLHIDDKDVLFYINKRLKIGSVKIKNKVAEFIVTKKADMVIIFNIFNATPLNTTKYLNYISFKKAYFLYHSRNEYKINSFLSNEITKLKGEMNKGRKDFESNHPIYISDYWLLGFTEGDGSFNVHKKDLSLKYSIACNYKELRVFNAIKEYLLKLPNIPNMRRNTTNFVKVNIYKQAKGRDHEDLVSAVVNDSVFISSVIFPLFDSLIWLSKKKYDYNDFKTIFLLKKEGKHHLLEGKNLILLLCNRMNNNRLTTKTYDEKINILSTCGLDIVKTTLDNQISELMSLPSNYEKMLDGKILIKSSGLYLKGRGNVSVNVINDKSEVIYHFNSIKECALFFNVHSRSVIRWLDHGESKPQLIKGMFLIFKRESS